MIEFKQWMEGIVRPGLYVGVKFDLPTCQILHDWTQNIMKEYQNTKIPPPNEMHVTIIKKGSKQLSPENFQPLGNINVPIQLKNSNLRVYKSNGEWGSQKYLVIELISDWLNNRYKNIIKKFNADGYGIRVRPWDSFQPHITLCYNFPGGNHINLQQLQLPVNHITIVEEFAGPFVQNWKDDLQ